MASPQSVGPVNSKPTKRRAASKPVNVPPAKTSKQASQKTASPVKRATRKASANIVTHPAADESSETVPTRSTRRTGRLASDSPSTASDEKTSATAKRTTRSRKAPVKEVEAASFAVVPDVPVSPVKPVAKPKPPAKVIDSPVQRATRRGKRAQIEAPISSEITSSPVQQSPAKRATRGRKTTAKTVSLKAVSPHQSAPTARRATRRGKVSEEDCQALSPKANGKGKSSKSSASTTEIANKTRTKRGAKAPVSSPQDSEQVSSKEATSTSPVLLAKTRASRRKAPAVEKSPPVTRRTRSRK